MAIFECKVSSISRGQGRSSVAAAAYRSGEELHCEYTGLTHDYRGKHYIEKTEIMLPNNAPSEWNNRETLWNTVEKVEKSKDAKLAEEVMVAIPRELNKEQREQLIYDFCDELRNKGFIVDYAIHCPPSTDDLKRPIDELGFPTKDPSRMTFNPHAHIMLPIRPLNPEGDFIKRKAESEYVCKNPETGEKRRLTSLEIKNAHIKWEKVYPCLVDGKLDYLTKTEAAQLNVRRESLYPLKTRHGRPDPEYAYRMSKEFVDDIRKEWEKYANVALEKADITERIDRRSYKDQRSDKIAEPHLGPIVTQMERKARRLEIEGKHVPQSIRSDIAEMAKEIRKHNHMVDLYERQMKEAGGYADRLATIKKLWISEKCHVKQLEDFIQKLSPDLENLEVRLDQFKESSAEVQKKIGVVISKKEDLEEQLQSTSVLLVPVRKKLNDKIKVQDELLTSYQKELKDLRNMYGYMDEKKIQQDQDLLNEGKTRLSEYEDKLISSREKVKNFHDQYFEIKKMVPVKIRKTVRVQVDRQVSMSAEIQSGIAAFGQLFIIASQIVEREIEEEEYREARSR